MKMGWYNAGETAGTMLVRNDKRSPNIIILLFYFTYHRFEPSSSNIR